MRSTDNIVDINTLLSVVNAMRKAERKARGEISKMDASTIARKAMQIYFNQPMVLNVASMTVQHLQASVAKELAGQSSTAINTHYTHLPVETLAKAIGQLPQLNP